VLTTDESLACGCQSSFIRSHGSGEGALLCEGPVHLSPGFPATMGEPNPTLVLSHPHPNTENQEPLPAPGLGQSKCDQCRLHSVATGS
jgi:hypothetical protein